MIDHKRKLLENFLQQQIIGPGALNGKLIHLGKDAGSKDPDILYAPPASIYSSGILFPLKDNKSETSPASGGATIDSRPASDDNDENIELIEENPTPMFNNTIGLSFVVKSIDDLKKIKIEVSGRSYYKLKPKLSKLSIGVKLEIDAKYFSSLLSQYETVKNLVLVDSDHICLFETFDFKTDSASFFEELKLKKQNLCEDLVNEFSLDPNKYKYLASVEALLYRGIKKQKIDSLIKAISRIEEINLLESYIRDLLNLEKGVWISNEQKAYLDLSKIPIKIENHRKNYTYKKYPDSLQKIIVSDNKQLQLSCNVSLSSNRREETDNNIYTKIQFVNTSPKVAESENHKYSVVNDEVNFRSLFDAKIRVMGSSNFLRPYNTLNLTQKNEYEEDDTTKYLYRELKDYAIGHNCSADWKVNDTEIILATTFFPSIETPDVDTIPRKSDIKVFNEETKSFEPRAYIENPECLEIKTLSIFSNKTDDQVIDLLHSFNNYYFDWITKKRNSKHKILELAHQELDKCEKDFNRIKRNIQYLDKDRSYALKAFRLMNSSMFMQMWHSQKVKKNSVIRLLNNNFKGFNEEFYKNESDHIFNGSSVGWRPFQLAFILLNIDGFINVDESTDWYERNKLVDLVWFPTGGGKTEAYLGIIAFTILLRRLKNNEKGGGVSVIMRYTLRLLTLQQFQRATILIIALELIRRWKSYKLGEEPITIGMWVGKNSLPNTRDELSKEFDIIDDQIENSGEKEHLNIRTKLPFTHCPCCGTFLFDKKERYRTESLNERYVHGSVRLKCRNNKCSFSHPPRARRREDQYALPILLSDEDIYENPPTLLFGTVDKFALLAHKTSSVHKQKDSRRIFGNKDCSWEAYRSDGYNPPELIIQDELHLLSGPLGTAVALFENAIDQLCFTNDGNSMIRPKIISSTATTRNTALQIAKLYNRDVSLFPKPGIDCDDSFFAFYKRRAKNKTSEFKYESKRKYIGFLPTGRTQMWMQMRLLALCFVHRALFEDGYINRTIFESKDEKYPKKALDYYHTVISYFNSKKEVGKTSSQIDTYLIKEIRKVFSSVLRPGKSLYHYYCHNLRQLELTGRLSGAEVQKNLSIVESEFSNSDRIKGKTPPDLVIATNMISVGLDVSRFNLILMNSMPRNIAEYIQASSRVARNSSGLVLTLHHPFRSRDLSHFEKFKDFHEKFYGYVEPISITPFAEKALRRYLNLYVASLIRQKEFPDRKDANKITEEKARKLKANILTFFTDERSNLGTTSRLPSKTLSLISEIIDSALNEWINRSKNSDSLCFDHAKKNEDNLYISINEYESNIDEDFWKIPLSLRSVEPETVIRILNK